MYQIGEIAKLAGVSQRTLRHYDELGLVMPSFRSDAGYRLYALEDIERLQEVLFYRELGFELSAIRKLLDDPTHDRAAALVAQRALLEAQAERSLAMIELVDRTLDSMREGDSMSAKDLLEVFGGFDPAKHEAEAKRRWGNTDAYKEAARRTKRYSKQDWMRIQEGNRALIEQMIAAFDRGVSPTDAEAVSIAEEARLAIDRDFYPCSHAMHATLGQMYVSDPRFKQHYDQHREGLAEWSAAAINANLKLQSERPAGQL